MYVGMYRLSLLVFSKCNIYCYFNIGIPTTPTILLLSYLKSTDKKVRRTRQHHQCTIGPKRSLLVISLNIYLTLPGTVRISQQQEPY